MELVNQNFLAYSDDEIDNGSGENIDTDENEKLEEYQKRRLPKIEDFIIDKK